MVKTFSYIQKFNDFEEFSASMQVYDIDLQLLEAGPYTANLHQFLSGALLLSYFTSTRSVEAVGNAPENLITFGVPTEHCQPFIWRNQHSDGNTIQVYRRNTELEMVTQTLFQAIDFSLPEEDLDHQCKLMELPCLEKITSNADMLTCNPVDMKQLRYLLLNICQLLGDNPKLINTTSVQYKIKSEIPRLLLKAISHAEHRKHKRNFPKKNLALNKAIDYIKSNKNSLITLDTLCLEAQCSARTLQQAFLERFGLTPKAYLRVQRLNSVYKQLSYTSSHETKVADVAYQEGFNHLSQFAYDYRNLFGELPSATLRKN
jgi:AraC-like DNA-binding protein